MEPDFSRPPNSLEVEPSAAEVAEAKVTTNEGPLTRLLWLLGYHSDEALTIRGATSMYEAVCLQVDDSELHAVVGLPQSFYSRWSALLENTVLMMFVVVSGLP